MKVIDISDYSEGLDWDSIAANEGGVIIKISEGRTPSELFEQHYQAAISHGLEYGVYCLSHARTVERAGEEADEVINLLQGKDVPPLYIWFDVEPDLADEMDSETLTAVVSAFISECNAYGYDAGVYGNYSTLNKINTGELADYVMYWVAEPGNPLCYFKAEHPELRVMAWQYEFDNTDYGGVVDKNEWYE